MSAYRVALLLIKKEDEKEFVVCSTEDLNMDYHELRNLYSFREEHNDGYMDYYLDIPKEELPTIYDQTKRTVGYTKRQLLKYHEEQLKVLDSIMLRTDYDFIRIHIYEFDCYGVD